MVRTKKVAKKPDFSVVHSTPGRYFNGVWRPLDWKPPRREASSSNTPSSNPRSGLESEKEATKEVEKDAEKEQEEEAEKDKEQEEEAEKEAVDGEVEGGRPDEEKSIKQKSLRPEREKKQSKFVRTPYRAGAGVGTTKNVKLVGDDKPAALKRKNAGVGTTKNKKSKT